MSNREIKFRAWEKEAKKMRYFGKPTYCSEYNLLAWELDEASENPDGSTYGNLDADYIGDFEVMQYTGLKDKNGKEIYEGDVVRNNWHNINGEYIGGTYIVKFGEYSDASLEYGSSGHIGFYAERIGSHVDAEDFQEALGSLPTNDGPRVPEVIGNIYENPELVNGGSK